jgi:integrase
MKGHTFKRCPCGTVFDEKGKRINCPKKHGSWYFAHELPPGPDGKRRQSKAGGFPTEREARRAMNSAIGEVQSGTWVDYPKVTVGEYLDQWLAGKATLRSSTRRSYGEHIALYLKPGLGHLKLSELTDLEVERLYAAMRELGTEPDESGEVPSDLLLRLLAARRNPTKARVLSAACIRRVHATLMSALNSAVKRKRMAFNPAQHVELPSGRRPRAVVWTDERVEQWKRTGEHPAVAVWTPQQTGAFLDAAAGDRLYPIYHLIAYRGLRRGEAAGVRWQDVDLAGRQLDVAQQIVQLGWATEIGAPKTDSGARRVSLDSSTVEVLRRWRNRQEGERAANPRESPGVLLSCADGP